MGLMTKPVPPDLYLPDRPLNLVAVFLALHHHLQLRWVFHCSPHPPHNKSLGLATQKSRRMLEFHHPRLQTDSPLP